jgi:hypothetical protein
MSLARKWGALARKASSRRKIVDDSNIFSIFLMLFSKVELVVVVIIVVGGSKQNDAALCQLCRAKKIAVRVQFGAANDAVTKKSIHIVFNTE